jgi:light-dependent protochlorophyllide reductase
VSIHEIAAAREEEAMDAEARTGTVVVTGGNSGLGYACAEAISAAGGWHVVLACRDVERGGRAAREISQATGSANVGAMGLDLASLASVRTFARALASREDLPPLRAVVCNAGLQVVSSTTYTADGFETTFGVNHLGHFLLVNLLLGEMTAPARVVFVSSGTHDPKRRTGMPAPRYRGAAALAYPEQHPDPGEKDEGPGAVGRRRYTTSKLCNVMCTYEMDRRLSEQGLSTAEAPICVNAFDPGGMPNTGLTREYGPAMRLAWDGGLTLLLPLLRRLGVAMSTAQDSGRALARLVIDPALAGVSGGYFEIGERARSSEESYDPEEAAELWETSAGLVGLGREETPLRTAATAGA